MVYRTIAKNKLGILHSYCNSIGQNTVSQTHHRSFNIITFLVELFFPYLYEKTSAFFGHLVQN